MTLALALLATACGGGGGGGGSSGDASTMAVTLVASVEGCTTSAVSDSGHVVYVMVEPSCGAPGVQRNLTVGTVSAEATNAVQSLKRVISDINTSSVSIDGLGERQVEIVARGSWRKLPHTGTWAPRDGAGLLLLGGHAYLLGGWLWGEVTNEVWRSRDLVQWEFLGYAPWPARHGAGWLVHDNRLWVIGGDLLDDVWSSPDGMQWTQEAQAAPFGRRYTPNVASINGKIVVYAGQDWQPVEGECSSLPCSARGLRSVWTSGDGRHWEEVAAEVPWAGRALVHGSIVHDGEIWMIGGGLKESLSGSPTVETSAQFTDIWSSPDGAQWTRQATVTGFPGRTHFSVLGTAQGCYVSDGSVDTQSNLSNDVFFARDCINFAPVPTPNELPLRHASSLMEFNGSLVLLGGPPFYGGAVNEVWQYFP